MPLLDVSDVLLDPLFCERIEAVRRVEQINGFGENSFQNTIFQTFGCVVPVDPKDLDRMPDAQIDRKTIQVITKFRLQIATPSYQADLIRWHGDVYVVISVSDWSGYGGGFIEAVAQSIDLEEATLLVR